MLPTTIEPGEAVEVLRGDVAIASLPLTGHLVVAFRAPNGSADAAAERLFLLQRDDLGASSYWEFIANGTVRATKTSMRVETQEGRLVAILAMSTHRGLASTSLLSRTGMPDLFAVGTGFAQRTASAPWPVPSNLSDFNRFFGCAASTDLGAGVLASVVCHSGGKGATSCSTTCTGSGSCSVTCAEGYACCDKLWCTCRCEGTALKPQG